MWKYHPKQVEKFPDINKLCNVASCWIYEYIRMLLGAHHILHISRIKVKHVMRLVASSTCFIFENTELNITHSHPVSVVLSNPSLSTQHLPLRLHTRYEIKRGLGLPVCTLNSSSTYTLNPLHKNCKNLCISLLELISGF
jgi:hypothetical protein